MAGQTNIKAQPIPSSYVDGQLLNQAYETINALNQLGFDPRFFQRSGNTLTFANNWDQDLNHTVIKTEKNKVKVYGGTRHRIVAGTHYVTALNVAGGSWDAGTTADITCTAAGYIVTTLSDAFVPLINTASFSTTMPDDDNGLGIAIAQIYWDSTIGGITQIRQIVHGDIWEYYMLPDSLSGYSSHFLHSLQYHLSHNGNVEHLGLYGFNDLTATAIDKTTDHILFRQVRNMTSEVKLRYCDAAQLADYLDGDIYIDTDHIDDLIDFLNDRVDSHVSALHQYSIDMYTDVIEDILGLYHFDTGTNDGGIELDAQSKILFRDFNGTDTKTLAYATRLQLYDWLIFVDSNTDVTPTAYSLEVKTLDGIDRVLQLWNFDDGTSGLTPDAGSSKVLMRILNGGNLPVLDYIGASVFANWLEPEIQIPLSQISDAQTVSGVYLYDSNGNPIAGPVEVVIKVTP